MQKIRQGDLFQSSSYFFKKSFIWDKSMLSALYFQYILVVVDLEKQTV